jgi:lambda family phage portal protein
LAVRKRETYEELEARLTREANRELRRLKKQKNVVPAPKTDQRMYASARASRLTTEWLSSNTSADTELSSSLTQLRARSRALCRDVSYAKRAKTLVVNNVIGSGIGMQAQVHNARGDLNKRVNDEIETVWWDWSRADSCHTGGRLSFAELERALQGQVFEAGEVFVRKHYRAFGGSAVPYALEIIEAERIADDMVSPPTLNRNEYRMGVEVDPFHRPVAYYIKRRHPGELRFMGGSPDEIERVPADQIIHLAIGDRWPQTRGEPWMASVINTFRNSAGYVEAEITRARIQASQPWTIETSEAMSTWGQQQPDGSVEMIVEPGIAKRLNPGEKMSVPPINSPNTAIEAFMRYLLRDIAAGSGPSYESLSRDYSQSNYSSSRLALLDDRDLWRVFQSWFICAFREPVHREWMQQAVLAGAFQTFSVQQWALNRKKYEEVRFRPRGWGWVDPTKEVAAYKEAVRAGFMTQQDVIAATSRDDFEEVVEQRAKEVDMTKEAGLSFDTDPGRVASTDPPSVDPPSDDDDDGTPDEPDTEPALRRVFSLRR